MTIHLEKARAQLAAGEPWDAWGSLGGPTPPLPQLSDEVLSLLADVLDAICRDLEEHGAAHLDLVNGAVVSMDECFTLRAAARQAHAERRTGPLPPPPPVPFSAMQLGEPRLLCAAVGPSPVQTARGFVSLDGNRLVLRAFDDGAVVQRFAYDDGFGDVKSVALSPDGAWLAVGHTMAGRVQLFAISTGARAWTCEHPGEGWCTRLAFAPSGNTLALGTRNLRLLDVATGEARGMTEVYPVSLSELENLTYAPTGKTLFASSRSRLSRFDAQTLQLVDSHDVTATHLIALDETHLLGSLEGQLSVVAAPGPEAGTSWGREYQLLPQHLSVDAARQRFAVLGKVYGGPHDGQTRLSVGATWPLRELASVQVPGELWAETARGGVSFGPDTLLAVTRAGTFSVPWQ